MPCPVASSLKFVKNFVPRKLLRFESLRATTFCNKRTAIAVSFDKMCARRFGHLSTMTDVKSQSTPPQHPHLYIFSILLTSVRMILNIQNSDKLAAFESLTWSNKFDHSGAQRKNPCGLFTLCARRDSNPRRKTPSDLQSDAFDRSATDASTFVQLQTYNYVQVAYLNPRIISDMVPAYKLGYTCTTKVCLTFT